MKNFTIIIAILFLTASLPLEIFAQNDKKQTHKDIMAKLIADKKDYLKEKIPLSEKEAEVFFAVYDELEMKKFETAHNVFREASKIRRSTEYINDKIYLKMAEEQALVSIKIAELEQEYFLKFKNILSPKQLFMYYQWEHRFAKEMIKREQKKVNNVK
ncbi:MAG: hypothetical protein RR293_01585 [Bacteroidales bacterium]